MKSGRKSKKWYSRLKTLFVKCLAAVLVFTLIQVVSLKFVRPLTTPNVVWEWAESLIKKDPSKRPSYIWKEIKSISPHLRRAVLAAEDQRFLSHNGFDYNEIKAAVKRLIKERRIRGASTISMQTARSVFLLSSKSFMRKIAEAYYTFLIELFWSKQRILEMYLNTVDWGTGVTGAEAAAQKYFNKSARHLTAAESALMTAILPNPHRWSIRQPTPYLRMRQQQIMKDLHLMPLL